MSVNECLYEAVGFLRDRAKHTQSTRAADYADAAVKLDAMLQTTIGQFDIVPPDESVDQEHNPFAPVNAMPSIKSIKTSYRKRT